MKIFKATKFLLSPVLSFIINTSFTVNMFPKISKDWLRLTNFQIRRQHRTRYYQPISTIPILSNIFQKIVSDQLFSVFNQFQLLHPSQFGFREKLSVSYTVSNMQQFIYNNLGKRYTVLSVILDFSWVFDCVDYKFLLHNLNVHGARGVALPWFQSFLSKRIHYVYINDGNSDHLPVVHGFLQGYILDCCFAYDSMVEPSC